MDHHDAREMLSARADGELDPSAARALDDHLEGCAPCRTFGDGLARLRALAVELPRVREPERLWPDLLQYPSARAGGRSDSLPRSRRPSWWRSS